MCFADNKLTIINVSIRKNDRNNLNLYWAINNNITFLAFNYSNEIFIEDLSNKIKIAELEDYLKPIYSLISELTNYKKWEYK